MQKIAIELVPRGQDALQSELDMIQNRFPMIDTINIPDLLRYDMRSWTGCAQARCLYSSAIPHIRAIDIDLDQPLPMADFLRSNGLLEVLVIQGDLPQDMSRKIYPSNTIDVIRKFKREMPDVRVYAGIDQYRDSIHYEADYIRRKIRAGADGFFTQPFFDLRLLEIYGEILAGQQVFWGVSPVVSDKSVSYWEAKNKAVFPAAFEPSLAWNIEFARATLQFVRRTDTNIYFMPIRIDIQAYLDGVFA